LIISIVVSVMFGVTAIVDRNEKYGSELDYVSAVLLFLAYAYSSWTMYHDYRQTLHRSHEGCDVTMARVVQRSIVDVENEVDESKAREEQAALKRDKAV